MLQAGRSRVRSPMWFLNFLNLPNPCGNTRFWGHSASNKTEYKKQKNNLSGELSAAGA
jgi:hypothetical protein